MEKAMAANPFNPFQQTMPFPLPHIDVIALRSNNTGTFRTICRPFQVALTDFWTQEVILWAARLRHCTGPTDTTYQMVAQLFQYLESLPCNKVMRSALPLPDPLQICEDDGSVRHLDPSLLQPVSEGEGLG